MSLTTLPTATFSSRPPLPTPLPRSTTFLASKKGCELTEANLKLHLTQQQSREYAERVKIKVLHSFRQLKQAQVLQEDQKIRKWLFGCDDETDWTSEIKHEVGNHNLIDHNVGATDAARAEIRSYRSEPFRLVNVDISEQYQQELWETLQAGYRAVLGRQEEGSGFSDESWLDELEDAIDNIDLQTIEGEEWIF